MSFGNAPGDSQSESFAGRAGRIKTPEHFEYFVLMVLGDADTVIFNRINSQNVIRAAGNNDDARPGRIEKFQGVFQ